MKKLLLQLMVSVGDYTVRTRVLPRSNRLAMALSSRAKTARTVFRAFYSTVDTQFTAYEDIVPGDTLADDRPVSHEDPAAWFSIEWPVLASRIARGLPAMPRADRDRQVSRASTRQL